MLLFCSETTSRYNNYTWKIMYAYTLPKISKRLFLNFNQASIDINLFPLFHETQSRHEYGIYMIHLNQIICNKNV